MKFLKNLFAARPAEDYMSKGDALFDSHRFFEARCAYEEGLERHHGRDGGDGKAEMAELFAARIGRANRALAELNISEAESALSRGLPEKAAEHLELAKSLTEDVTLREKAELLLASMAQKDNDTKELGHATGGCGSCLSPGHEMQPVSGHEELDMSPQDYYDLLIRQLPHEMYGRYAKLGEEFACLYLAASRDDHAHALELLESWYHGHDSDIYWYEKGMILYRLGDTGASEACLRDAIGCDAANPLPYLGLALLLVDGGRLDEAGQHLDAMIANGILAEQSLMLRGDVSLLAGDRDGAVQRYGNLLATPLARAAAEKLYPLLLQSGRQQEAAMVFKQYLGGCKH